MMHQRVESLHQLGRFAEAEQLAREGLAEYPGDAFMQVLLARALLRQNRLGPAADAINRAVALAPDMAFAYRIKGAIHGASGFLGEAEKAYTRGITLDPHDPFTYVQRAYLDMEIAQAKPSLLKKITSKTKFAPDLSRAKGDLDEALRLVPAHPEVHLAIASLHAIEGRDHYAEIAAKRSLQLDPQNSGAHETLGMLAERKQDLRAASDHYVAAGRADPTSSSPLERLKKLGAPAVMVPSLAVYIGLRTAASIARVNTTMLVAVSVAAAIAIVAVIVHWQRRHRSNRRLFTSQAQQVIENDRRARPRRFRR